MNKNRVFMMFAAAAFLFVIAGPVLGEAPCESLSGKCYCVSNRTDQKIQWWDAAWKSPEVGPGNTECVSSDHNPEVKIWSLGGDKPFIGPALISSANGCLVVFGKSQLVLKTGLTRAACSKLTC